VNRRLPAARTLLAVTIVAFVAAAWLAFARPVEMLVDGDRIESDVPPIATVSDRVFVPLRTVADALGAQVSVEGKNRVDVVRGRQSLRVRVGDSRATIDGAAVTLSHPPFRVRGRVMIEVRAVASAFGVKARYDSTRGRVDLLTPGIGEAIEPVASLPTQ
jgi:hypothetical protein